MRQRYASSSSLKCDSLSMSVFGPKERTTTPSREIFHEPKWNSAALPHAVYATNCYKQRTLFENTARLGYSELDYNELGYNELDYNELGYNELGYNKYSVITTSVITNKIFSPKWPYYNTKQPLIANSAPFITNNFGRSLSFLVITKFDCASQCSKWMQKLINTS